MITIPSTNEISIYKCSSECNYRIKIIGSLLNINKNTAAVPARTFPGVKVSPQASKKKNQTLTLGERGKPMVK